jgi:hypothetical protein
MNDRMSPAILELAGRCPTCGQTRCGSSHCFRVALDRHDAPPVISRQAANDLIGRLVRGGMPRTRAMQRVHETFNVPA